MPFNYYRITNHENGSGKENVGLIIWSDKTVTIGDEDGAKVLLHFDEIQKMFDIFKKEGVVWQRK